MNGGSQAQKGNLGFANGNNVKGILIFDALPVMEEMADEPSGQLEIAFDWNKDPGLVEDVRVIFVGAFPNIEVKDSVFWPFYMKDGEEVAVIPAEDLRDLGSRKMINLPLEEVAPGGDASPANRYLVYRLEMTKAADDPELSNMVGMAPDGAEHTLYIGESKGGSGGSGGGYLNN